VQKCADFQITLFCTLKRAIAHFQSVGLPILLLPGACEICYLVRLCLHSTICCLPCAPYCLLLAPCCLLLDAGCLLATIFSMINAVCYSAIYYLLSAACYL